MLGFRVYKDASETQPKPMVYLMRTSVLGLRLGFGVYLEDHGT